MSQPGITKPTLKSIIKDVPFSKLFVEDVTSNPIKVPFWSKVAIPVPFWVASFPWKVKAILQLFAGSQPVAPPPGGYVGAEVITKLSTEPSATLYIPG